MLLNNKNKIQKFANRYLAAKSIFFIGRGIDYAISLEGSLKLKEVSYIHSEAYAAGELKHGTISLIEEGTLVCSVLTQEELYKKDDQQYGRSKDKRSICDGGHKCGQYGSGKGSRLCDLSSENQ